MGKPTKLEQAYALLNKLRIDEAVALMIDNALDAPTSSLHIM